MITGHEPVNILDLRGAAPPERQSKTAILYSTGGFLKKGPENFTRNEKLAFVENAFAKRGYEADSGKFVLEIRCSARLSAEAFQKARRYGLHVFKKRGSHEL